MFIIPRQSGTLANGADSEDTSLVWDESVGPGGFPSEQGVLTVTTSAEMTFYIREAANRAEIETPYGGLHHQFSEVIPANSTRRFIVGQDASLPAGKAWLVNNSGGSGDYSYTGSRQSE